MNIQSEGLMMSVCVSDEKKKVCKELRLLDQGKRNSTCAPLFFFAAPLTLYLDTNHFDRGSFFYALFFAQAYFRGFVWPKKFHVVAASLTGRSTKTDGNQEVV